MQNFMSRHAILVNATEICNATEMAWNCVKLQMLHRAVQPAIMSTPVGVCSCFRGTVSATQPTVHH